MQVKLANNSSGAIGNNKFLTDLYLLLSNPTLSEYTKPDQVLSSPAFPIHFTTSFREKSIWIVYIGRIHQCNTCQCTSTSYATQLIYQG